MTVELERWVHMAKDGWYSGELHIHANYGYGAWFNTPETMRQQCVGEDLNVCNFMVANSDADVVFDRPFFRGGPDPLSTPENILYWNQEFRSTVWGHMTLVNLKQVVEPVFTGFEGTTNPWDYAVQRRHRRPHALAEGRGQLHARLAGRGLVEDALRGEGDPDRRGARQDRHARHQQLVGGVGAALVSAAELRLPRAGDGGDGRVPQPHRQQPARRRPRLRPHRRAARPTTDWIDGLKAGRSFVTNGPMLKFTVNGSEPGSVLKLGEKPKVRVKATARSQFPLTKAELVHNGKVIATATLADDKLTATLDQEVALDRGGWLAFRATAPAPRTRRRRP